MAIPLKELIKAQKLMQADQSYKTVAICPKCQTEQPVFLTKSEIEEIINKSKNDLVLQDFIDSKPK